MSIIIIALITWFVSQTVKFFLFLVKGGKVTPDSLLWIYIWIGKFPSSHTAMLASVLYTIWHKEGASSLFGFAVVCSAIFVFTLSENRKRYELLKGYCTQSNDPAIQKIVQDGKMDEFEGHTFIEIIAGVLLGITVATIIGAYA